MGAHKIEEHESSQVRMTSEGEDHIITHPNFNLEKILNDLGLVKLPQKVKFNGKS